MSNILFHFEVYDVYLQQKQQPHKPSQHKKLQKQTYDTNHVLTPPYYFKPHDPQQQQFYQR